ncbi:MAG: hypothetical protein RIR76_835 [Verrucomicrobiota bacterium]|jgi:hypothetical protein|nr:hypothetical protein [Opitutaceae bacterium]
MARLALVPLLVAGLAAPGAPAQTAAPSVPVAASSPVLSNGAPAAAPSPSSRRSRAISGDAASALAAFAPKYEPPPPPPPPPKPEEEQPDLREVDKPKNTIVRLPSYIVQEKKPPIFRERDIHTKKGLTDLAMRRYISESDRALNRWTLPLFGTSKEARALAMYAEEERLKNMEDLRNAADNAAKSDTAAGDFIRRESRETYLRSGDFGWSNRNNK